MVLLFIGGTELLIIALVALLLFGGKKIPETMRGLGQGVRSFKQGMKEDTEPGHDGKRETSGKDSSPRDENGQKTNAAAQAETDTSSTNEKEKG